MIDEVSATCFGLTCKRHHAVYKHIYPIPILLWTPHLDTQTGEYWVLYELLDSWKGPDLVYTVVSIKPLQLPAERGRIIEILQSLERSLDLIRKYKDVYEVESGLRWDDDAWDVVESIYEDISDKEEVEVCFRWERYVSMKHWLEMEKTHWRY